MQSAVTAVLDRGIFPVLQRGTCLETRMILARFQTEPEARLLARGGPHSRRNLWQPQATGNHSFKGIISTGNHRWRGRRSTLRCCLADRP